jgi:hypothetical protein
MEATMRAFAAIASALSLAGGLAGQQARAASIKLIELPGVEYPVITLRGDIVSGDDEKFRTIALANPRAVVELDSDGGSLRTALEIGRIIRLGEFDTVVGNDQSCASACALIWLAGAHRTMVVGGRIGFHASYVDLDGSLIQTGMGNALVGHYLSQLAWISHT